MPYNSPIATVQFDGFSKFIQFCNHRSVLEHLHHPKKFSSSHLQSTLLSPQAQATIDVLSSLCSCLFQKFHVYTIVEYVVICVWIISSHITSLWFIHAVECIVSSFFFNAERSSVVWICHFCLSAQQLLDSWTISTLGLL